MQITSVPSEQKLVKPHRQILAPYSVGYRIKLLSQLTTRKLQDLMEPFGLTPFHWLVLCCLWEEDGLPTCSIGEKLQQVGGTITGVLDRMEERGLVRRERDVEDRRIWRIWLTAEGKKLEAVLPPLAMELREQLLEGISLQDRDKLSQLVDQMIINMS